MRISSKIQDVVHQICEPDPKGLLDPTVSATMLTKNLLTFWITFLMATVQPFLSIVSGMPPLIVKAVSSWHIITFIIYVTLCRSYRGLFDLLFTLARAFMPIYLLNLDQGVIFLFFTYCLAMPTLVLVVTKSSRYTIFTAFSLVVITLTKFKGLLKIYLLNTNPEEFVERLISSNLAMTLSMTTMFFVILINLNKKTKELSQANAIAKDALEHQKTFLFSFSHELRNPLNSLLGNLQLVLMNKLPDDVRKKIKTAHICAELLLQLINNLLDAGKFETGRLEVSPVSTKVYDLFQRVWAISDNLITKKGLRSHLRVEKRIPPMLLIDDHRLNQVLMNLIGNAVKFTDEGSISVTVKWLDKEVVDDESFEPRPYDDEEEGIFEKDENCYMLSLNNSSPTKLHGHESQEHLVLVGSSREFLLDEIVLPSSTSKGTLKIIVRDTGSGMTEEAMSRLFKKFSQVSNDAHKRQIGTGLGLFITKEICKQMEGDVRVYSKPTVGTTFIVCVPTSWIHTNNHVEFGRPLNVVIERLAELRMRTIIADDSTFNVNLMSDYFSKLSISVQSTANNGYDAYQQYMNSRNAGVMIHIVTLDIDMPKMDGKMACQKIREYERRHGLAPTTIILISGNYAEEQVQSHLDSHGEKRADCFLKKPLQFEEFCSAVYRLKR